METENFDENEVDELTELLEIAEKMGVLIFTIDTTEMKPEEVARVALNFILSKIEECSDDNSDIPNIDLSV